MIDLIKRTLYAGVGLAVLTKEKVEELGRELAEQAKLSETEGREFVNHLMEQSEAARKELDARVSGAVEKAVSSLHLASKAELDRLSAKVEELSQKLSQHSHG